MIRQTDFVREIWYYAIYGGRLKRGQMMAKTMLDEPLLIGRDADGKVFAIRDNCPHRGMPLSYGRFDGREVECCYHGWRFRPDGSCSAIPSLATGREFDLSKVCVKRYPCEEVQGNIWIYFGDKTEDLPAIPRIPEVGDRLPAVDFAVELHCTMDNAAFGLVDPAHGAFVHKNWWWRSRKSVREKVRHYVPTPLGFKSERHAPTKTSLYHKILGGGMETEITFELPGLRFEKTWFGRHFYCVFNAVSPLTAETSEFSTVIYWTPWWLAPARPFVAHFMRNFMRQDNVAMERFHEGLLSDPPAYLVRDADQPAMWYRALKKEFQAAQAKGRPFRNPVKATELRWRT